MLQYNKYPLYSNEKRGEKEKKGTYGDEQKPGLEPGPAASEEGDDEGYAAGGEYKDVERGVTVLGNEGTVRVLVLQSHPETGSYESAGAQLRITSKIVSGTC